MLHPTLSMKGNIQQTNGSLQIHGLPLMQKSSTPQAPVQVPIKNRRCSSSSLRRFDDRRHRNHDDRQEEGNAECSRTKRFISFKRQNTHHSPSLTSCTACWFALPALSTGIRLNNRHPASGHRLRAVFDCVLIFFVFAAFG